MPRPPRYDPPGTWHHLMNRGARRQHVFIDDRDREDFVGLLRQFWVRFGVEVHLYCLVGNHFHVVVRSMDGRISDAMKFLGERFTRHSNDRHGFDGSIFRGRFHNEIVESHEHHLWLFNYVHTNARDAGWRESLARYPWSSLWTYLAEIPSTGRDPWLRTEFYAELFGDNIERMAAFLDLELDPPDSIAFRPSGRGRRQADRSAPGAPLQPRPLRLADDVAFDCAVRAVMEEWRCEAASFTDHPRGRCNEPRLALVLIATDVFRCSTSLIAGRLRLSSAAGVRVLRSRARRRIDVHAEFAASIDRIIAATSAQAA